MIVVQTDSGSYGRLTGLPPNAGHFLQQSIMGEVLSQRVSGDPRTEQTRRLSSPIYALQLYYSQQLTVITDLARETIDQMENSLAEFRSSPPFPETLLQFKGSLNYLKAILKIAEGLPSTITAKFYSDEKEVLLETTYREDLNFLIGTCELKFDEFKEEYNTKYVAPILSDLGWNLVRDQDQLNNLKKAFKKIYSGMVIPGIQISSEREISMKYSWRNYVIDNRMTPANLRILDLISRLPKEVDIPSDYLCPLTTQIMLFPMRANGHVYDRPAITATLREQAVCPFTRAPLKPEDLVFLEPLQREICNWVETQFVKITVVCNAGKGNYLTIRGEKGPLHWSKGIPLKYIGKNRWEIELPYVPGCQFKLLINDKTHRWEEGHNHTLSKEPITLRPTFPS